MELKGDTIHAETQTSGPRAIGEHVAKVSAASGAVDFGTGHSVASILDGTHRVRQCGEKTRPAAAALVFRIRIKKQLSTSGACEAAGSLFVVQRARARPFRSVLAEYTILFRCELSLPFILCLLNRKSRILHAVSLTF